MAILTAWWVAAVLGAPQPLEAAPMEPEVAAAVAYLSRSGEDGRAMADYMARDPLPITFGNPLPGKAGEYRSSWIMNGARRTIVDARIVLDHKLRSGGVETIGEVLYHEYIHRLQDRFDPQGMRARPHSSEGFDRALGELRREVGAPKDLRSSGAARRRCIMFASNPNPRRPDEALAAAMPEPMHEGDAPSPPRAAAARRSRQALSMRGFELFSTRTGQR